MFPVRLFPNTSDCFPFKQIKRDPVLFITHSIFVTLAYVFRKELLEELNRYSLTIIVICAIALPTAVQLLKLTPPKSTGVAEVPSKPLSEEDQLIKNLLTPGFVLKVEESHEDSDLFKSSRVDLDYFYLMDLDRCKQKLRKVLKGIDNPTLLKAVNNSLMGCPDPIAADLERVTTLMLDKDQEKDALKSILEDTIAIIKQEIKDIREQYKKNLEALRVKHQALQAKL